VNPRRLRIGEWIAGIGGVALIGVTFLDWYEVESERSFSDGSSAVVLSAKGSASAWEAFTVIDLMLALTAAMGIGVAVMAAVHDTPPVSLALASLLGLVGLVATIAVVVRAIALPEFSVDGATIPDDAVSIGAGLWLGLAAVAATTVGAFVSMRDERFPRGARVEPTVETLPPPEGGKA
jgi:hypothetical protein